MSESTAQLRHISVRSRIYRTLYDAHDFVSSCGISMPTLYQNLNELMGDGLVRYSGEDRSTGGRRAQGLDIVPDARVSVGISVTEHRLRFVAADLRLRELAYKAVDFDITALLNNGDEDLARALEQFLDEAGIDRLEIEMGTLGRIRTRKKVYVWKIEI